jgi:hypothetical protein
VRSETPAEALFVVPIDIQDFRGKTHRAQVVDWKHFPFRPDAVREWRERIDAFAPEAGDIGPRAAFDGAPASRIAAGAERYGADLVITRTQDLACAGGTVAFADRFG